MTGPLGFSDIPAPGAGRRPNGSDPDHQLPIIEWTDERLSKYHGRELSPRLWVVPDWIPREQVTGLYGVGGINKTDFLIMLLMAKSRGLIFLEYVLQAAPVYGLFCEDTREEIVRRATRIAAKAWDLALADFPDFHFASLVGVTNKEFVTFENGEMTIMPALRRVDETIEQLGAQLFTLDTLPHFYGGNEVHRRDVTRFITVMDAVSIGRGCGIVFTAHPSQRGRQSGSMDSGSTGWEGSVRARLALEDPGPAGTAQNDPAPKISSERRVLTRIKANYAKAGETIDLTCVNGVFTVVTTAIPGAPPKPPKRGPERDAACDAKFLELLAKVTEEGRTVSESPHGQYAPKVFAVHPAGLGFFSAAEFTRAMARLFNDKRLRLMPYGPPSREQRKLVEIEPEATPKTAQTTPEKGPAEAERPATVDG